MYYHTHLICQCFTGETWSFTKELNAEITIKGALSGAGFVLPYSGSGLHRSGGVRSHGFDHDWRPRARKRVTSIQWPKPSSRLAQQVNTTGSHISLSFYPDIRKGLYRRWKLPDCSVALPLINHGCGSSIVQIKQALSMPVRLRKSGVIAVAGQSSREFMCSALMS